MAIQFTADFMKVPEGYTAFVEELPSPKMQGARLAQARGNPGKAVELVLDANRAPGDLHCALHLTQGRRRGAKLRDYATEK